MTHFTATVKIERVGPAEEPASSSGHPGAQARRITPPPAGRGEVATVLSLSLTADTLEQAVAKLGNHMQVASS